MPKPLQTEKKEISIMYSLENKSSSVSLAILRHFSRALHTSPTTLPPPHLLQPCICKRTIISYESGR